MPGVWWRQGRVLICQLPWFRLADVSNRGGCWEDSCGATPTETIRWATLRAAHLEGKKTANSTLKSS
ncbi:hypothetical protein RRG08_056297 [Elysia crispata]|uniref:Uncharacterized protein n=1 Tax=Elysia crispata TaxID=231223 RepID=A0AAE1E719_9GAST|nr:hypothetical protein RRG08_056297 [Elysia crispata]